jgi:hypothetical protein
MRRILISFLLIQIGLSVFAQSITIDSSFVPFFDIRSHSNSSIRDLVELPSGNIVVSGNFVVSITRNSYRNLTSLVYSGAINSNFPSTFRPNEARSFHKINNKFYHISNNNQGNIIDTNNQFTTYPRQSWRSNALKTTQCRQGTPYFYPDGSSIFPNGFSQTANGPCPIINLPDTFPGMYLVKVKPDGLWDSTFRAFPNHTPNGVVRYDSSRLLVYGFPSRFTHYNGVRVNGLCRIFSDGSLDTTFQSPFIDTLAVSALAPILIENGNVFIGGQFYVESDSSFKTFLKLSANGSIDSTFSLAYPTSSTSPYAQITTIAKTDDNGYLVGGIFDQYQGNNIVNIAKIDSLGNLEPQYFTGAGPDSTNSIAGPSFMTVSKILKSKFGGYYVAGYFLKWDGQPSQPIVRIQGLNTTVGLAPRAESRGAQGASSVLVYPNPSNGIFKIESEVGIESIEVLNMLGASALFGNLQNNSDFERSREARIDLLDYPKGIYFLKVFLVNGAVVVKKVFKT